MAVADDERYGRRLFDARRVNAAHPELADTVHRQLEAAGLVTFTGLHSVHAVNDVVAEVMNTASFQGPGPYGLHEVRDTRRHAHRADAVDLTRASVELHTSGAALRKPPRLVLIACINPGHMGGQTRLADGHAVFGDLLRERPDTAHALSRKGASLLGRGDDVFPARVFTVRVDRAPVVRLRQDGLVRWPTDSQPHLPVLRNYLALSTMSVTLRAGEAYLLDNHRWLHGRTAFTGPRHFYRAEGKPRRRLRDDAWPGEAS
ncbi:TauD/TfdA family dioxygenase [Streptomyces sp. NPDC000405]|uniref:TauD/TfdA family dioxygenase n=1 Tax=Streptomyces sp. NPDC000405 TaxID=3161033 RepID=UPI00398D465D